MSYLVLARKWRPQTFEEVVGQAHVTRTLQNAITSGRVGHSYLFTGPRGVGKTSTARILAKAMNCVEGPTAKPCCKCPSCLELAGPGSVDVVEIDGASNNGVENIRDLREKVLYAGVRDRHKVYIIDEVHMLTTGAFNALLKTLEEPPSHVIFILATTEAQKIPATILSRTQRFDFRRITTKDLAGHLKKMLDSEKIPSVPEALGAIARAASGSLRDSQTLLDQVISFCGTDDKGAPNPVTAEAVLQVLGGVGESQALAALKSAMAGDVDAALKWVQGLYERGVDFRVALGTVHELLRGLLLAKTAPQAAAEEDLLPETTEALVELASSAHLSRLFSFLKLAGETEGLLRMSSNQRLALELFFIRLSPAAGGMSLGELFDQLAGLEKKLEAAPLLAPSAAKTAVSAPAPVPPPAPFEDPVAPALAVLSEPQEAPARESGMPQAVVEEIEEEAPPLVLGLNEVKALWEKVVEKSSDISLQLSTSLQSVEITAVDKESIHLLVRNATQRDTLQSKDFRGQIESILAEVMGIPLKLEVVFSQVSSKGVKPRSAKDGPSPEEVEDLLAKNPDLRKMQQMFDAEIVQIKKV